MDFFRRLIAVFLQVLMTVGVFFMLPIAVFSYLIQDSKNATTFVREIGMYDEYTLVFQNSFVEYLGETSAGQNLSLEYRRQIAQNVISSNEIEDLTVDFTESFYNWLQNNPDEAFTYSIDLPKPADWPITDEAPTSVKLVDWQSDSVQHKSIVKAYNTMKYMPVIFLISLGVLVGLTLLIMPGNRLTTLAVDAGLVALGTLVSVLSLKGIKSISHDLAEDWVTKAADTVKESLVSKYFSMDPVKLVTDTLDGAIKWLVDECVKSEMNFLYIVLIVCVVAVLLRLAYGATRTVAKLSRKKGRTKEVGELPAPQQLPVTPSPTGSSAVSEAQTTQNQPSVETSTPSTETDKSAKATGAVELPVEKTTVHSSLEKYKQDRSKQPMSGGSIDLEAQKGKVSE